ncbi:hypothetical protein L798_12255 [Zootermopsis nevadensis]|uniref:Uncharacterized protein n=1 Tax=Zootermopsis nevadensis TaxID=136037 RepID=A0A067R5R8_ZOONE|nr:hypothetical protein L798_12255 [Zootermopsis nevadensis]
MIIQYNELKLVSSTKNKTESLENLSSLHSSKKNKEAAVNLAFLESVMVAQSVVLLDVFLTRYGS